MLYFSYRISSSENLLNLNKVSSSDFFLSLLAKQLGKLNSVNLVSVLHIISKKIGLKWPKYNKQLQSIEAPEYIVSVYSTWDI